MNYEDYVTHILQKHRLAISLAVIRTKPENVTLEEHIQQLRTKMNDDMEVDNISICSDDFLIDETNDFETIIEQTNDNNDRNDHKFAGSNDKNDHCTETVAEVINKQDINTNIDQNNDIINIESRNEDNYIFDHQNETDDVEMICTQNLNDSITILENFDVANEFDDIDTGAKEMSCLDEVMDILMETDDNMTTTENAVSNKIPSKSTQENILTQLYEEIDVTQCFTDIDATQCESLDILATVDEDMLSQKYSYNIIGENQTLKTKSGQKTDKDAQSVVDLERINVNKLQYANNTVECHTSTSNIEIKSQNDLNKIHSDFEKIMNDTASRTCDLKSYRHTKEFKDIYKNVADIFNSKKNISEEVKAKNSDNSLDKLKNVQNNSQDILKHDITQDCTSKTHYSQSQITDLISIEDKYIHGIKRNANLPNKGVNEKKKKKDVKEKKKKKQNEDIIILEDDLINNSKTLVSTTKDVSNGDDISLPEIKLANISTKKDFSEKLKNSREKSKNKSDTRTKPNQTVLQESQMTDCIAPTNSSQILKQKNESLFVHIKENNAISNIVHGNDSMPLANDSTLNPDDNTLTVEDSRLNANYRLLHAQDSMLHTKDSMLLANNSALNAGDITLTVEDSRLNANYTLPHDKNSLLHAKDSALNAGNKMVTVEDSRLKANYRLLHAQDSMLHAKDSMLHAKDSALNAGNKMVTIENSRVNFNLPSALQANDNTVTTDGNMLFANDNLMNANNSMRNANDKILNAKNEEIDKDLFFEESQQTPAGAFPNNNISKDNLLPHFENFGIENYRVPNNETARSKSCPVFDKTLKDTLITDQLRSTDFDNSQNIQAPLNVISYNVDNSENTSNVEYQKGCTDFDNNFNSMEVTELVNATNIDEHNNMPTTENCAISDGNLDVEEVTDCELETIPFKIITELNIVKMFLNKRHEKSLSVKGYSSDTGYRSDSSSRNSLKLSQSLSSGLDQPAHSLFNYITESPLVVTTQDITEEISLVLGQLIDKLHEEEKYPSFLEDMLQSIQRMLGLIYQHNGDENTLTNKDESIHRIILLNKSIHIQKYTIEKITNILEKFHAEMTSNASFEIQNIDQIENICHIFHLLEIILQKYNRTIQNLSQSTQDLSQGTHNLSQNTQEDEKSLKKSNIMDIWRKKWNPNYKEIQNEGSQEKKCVISNCNAVLNKLVVGCMEGYSLVSYFALKCFNAMQT